MAARQNRIWVLDLVRGVFMVTMILSHSIFFFHANTNSILQVLAAVGDLVSFTGLLLVSGAAAYVSYIHYTHPYSSVIVRLLKRVLMYLVGYYLLALWASGAWRTGNLSETFAILTFQKLVPFTEFIVPFIVLGFLKVPLRPLFQFLSKSLNATVIVSTLLYFSSTILAYQNISFFGKDILVGGRGVYSFPILSYLPIYLIGLYLGRRFFLHNSYKDLKRFLTSSTVFFAAFIGILAAVPFVTHISPYDLFNRFPPAPAFLLVGLAVSFLVGAVILELQELKNFPLSRTFLLLLGQNSFAVLVTHTILVYLYQYAELPKVHSPILTGLLTIFSTLLALYFAKILPLNYSFGLTFFNWCECDIRGCTHAKEHSIVKLVKKWLFVIVDIPRLFTVSIGGHRIALVKRWNLVFACSALLLAVTPLGIAENNAYFQNTLADMAGSVSKTWVLTTNPIELMYKLPSVEALTQGQPDVKVEYQLNNETPVEMQKEGISYAASFPTKNLKPGTYDLTALFTINYSHYKTATTTFYVTAPLLVTWTIDWEGYDASDEYLNAMGRIADEFGIPMTQLYNPRNFTAPDMPKERANYLTEWVKRRRDTKGDEIGLHLHMFLDFVETTSVAPIRDKVWGGGWTQGYDVLTTAYPYDAMIRILMYAKEVFNDRGLGQPRSYRAGGWFANIDTLQALADTGFLVDSSGRTAYSFGTNHVEGLWDLSPTVQPYFPSTGNQNSPNPPPRLLILEVPNNGADDYAFSEEEMIGRFDQNYKGGILQTPVQVTYLTHPNWFDRGRQEKMKHVFNNAKKFANKDDNGPVVFTTLSGVYQVWTSLNQTNMQL